MIYDSEILAILDNIRREVAASKAKEVGLRLIAGTPERRAALEQALTRLAGGDYGRLAGHLTRGTQKLLRARTVACALGVRDHKGRRGPHPATSGAAFDPSLLASLPERLAKAPKGGITLEWLTNDIDGIRLLILLVRLWRSGTSASSLYRQAQACNAAPQADERTWRRWLVHREPFVKALLSLSGELAAGGSTPSTKGIGKEQAEQKPVPATAARAESPTTTPVAKDFPAGGSVHQRPRGNSGNGGNQKARPAAPQDGVQALADWLNWPNRIDDKAIWATPESPEPVFQLVAPCEPTRVLSDQEWGFIRDPAYWIEKGYIGQDRRVPAGTPEITEKESRVEKAIWRAYDDWDKSSLWHFLTEEGHKRHVASIEKLHDLSEGVLGHFPPDHPFEGIPRYKVITLSDPSMAYYLRHREFRGRKYWWVLIKSLNRFFRTPMGELDAEFDGRGSQVRSEWNREVMSSPAWLQNRILFSNSL